MDPRLAKACNGASKDRGGLNVADLVELCEKLPKEQVDGSCRGKRRQELLDLLCPDKKPVKVLKIKKVQKAEPEKVQKTEPEQVQKAEPDEIARRLAHACRGQAWESGGLNVGDLIELCGQLPKEMVDGNCRGKRRQELLDILCRPEVKRLPLTLAKLEKGEVKKVMVVKKDLEKEADKKADDKKADDKDDKKKGELTESEQRLENACKGKARNNGGLNVPDLVKLCEELPAGSVEGQCRGKSRDKLLELLCKPKESDQAAAAAAGAGAVATSKEALEELKRDPSYGFDYFTTASKTGQNYLDDLNRNGISTDQFRRAWLTLSQSTRELWAELKWSNPKYRSQGSKTLREIRNLCERLIAEANAEKKKKAEEEGRKAEEERRKAEEERRKAEEERRKAEEEAKQLDQAAERKMIDFETEMTVQNAVIPLTGIVCSTVNFERSRTCTRMGEQISSAIIRIAAERIFDVPEQSIMEPIVNSVDSYRRKSGQAGSVGKFGMGFFSLLYWIVGHPNRTLEITSVYEMAGKKYGYKMTIVHDKGLEIVNNPTKNLDQRTPTGTEIKIVCNSADRIHPLSLDKMRRMISRLRYLDDVLIDVDNTIYYGNRSAPAKVIVKISPRLISISDQAEGIPVRVLFRSLLVPSSSTKTIAGSSEIKEVRDITSIIDPHMAQISPAEIGKSALMITVNNIIVNQTLTQPLTKAIQFVLGMPPSTRLPVARDNVIIESGSNEAKIFEERLMRLVTESITKYNDLTELFNVFDLYFKASNQPELFKIQNRMYDSVSKMTDVVFLPSTDPVHELIKKMFIAKGIKVASHPSASIYQAEQAILQHFGDTMNHEIFKSKSVMIINGLATNYTTGNLTRIMFVSKTYVDSNPKWQEAIISTSNVDIYFKESKVDTRQILRKVNITLLKLFKYADKNSTPFIRGDKKLRGKRDKITIERFTSVLSNLLNTHSGQFGRLHSNDFTDGLLMDIITQHVGCYLSNDRLCEYITYLASRLAAIRFNFSYGQPAIAKFRSSSAHRTYTVNYNGRQRSVSPSVMHGINLLSSEQSKTIDLDAYTTCVELLVFYHASNLATNTASDNSYKVPDIQDYIPRSIAGYNFTRMPGALLNRVLKIYINEAEIICFFRVADLLMNLGIAPEVLDPDFIFNEIRSRASPSQLDRMIYNDANGYIGDFELANRIISPVLQSAVLYHELSHKKKRVGPGLEYNGSAQKYVFTAKSLVEYVFNHDLTDDWLKTVDTFTRKYQFKQPVKLQIVEIAVNEGTTKDYMKAVLTELLQNSIDAIRQDSRPERKHSISVDIDRSVTIRDTVGIAPTNHSVFTAIMIPFLSTKKATDPNVTGEMGSGFFNVYRHPWCRQVVIRTVRDGQMTMITATPLKNKEMVTDIGYEVVQDQVKGEADGTAIEIVLNEQSTDSTAHALASAYEFTTNTMGFSDIQIVLNGNLLNIAKTLVYESVVYEVYVTENRTIPSLVMTNNVPFQPLSMLVSQYPVHTGLVNVTSSGVIVNIKKTAYLPVQSRTKITFLPSADYLAGSSLNDGLYMASVYRYAHNETEEAGNLIDHTYSRAHIDQLMLPVATVTGSDRVKSAYHNVLAHYTPGLLNEQNRLLATTIGGTINEIIQKKLAGEFKVPDLPGIRWDAVRRWFRNKDDKIKPKDHLILLTGKKDDKQLSEDQMKHLMQGVEEKKEAGKNNIVAVEIHNLQCLVDAYWSACVGPLGMSIRKDPPKVYFGKKDGAKGFYYRDKHAIIMDVPLKETEAKLREFADSKSIEMIRVDKILKSLISPTLPTTTLIHELYHAIRGDMHTSSAHPTHELTLAGRRFNGKFDEVALELYKIAVEHGLYQTFYQLMTHKN